jgi:lysozyme
MIASIQAINAIEQLEGFSSSVYNDTAGNATIGYGHLLHKSPKTVEDGKLVWTGEHAENMLKVEVLKIEQALNEKINVTVNQNQFDALVIWTYNLGIERLNDCSWLRMLNNEEYAEVPKLMQLWNKERIGGEFVVSKGLTNRRKFEADLFNNPYPSDNV